MAEWARNNTVELVSTQRRLFWRGPYFARRGPAVYRVRIRDAAGKEKDGWIGIVFHIPGFDTEVEWHEG